MEHFQMYGESIASFAHPLLDSIPRMVPVPSAQGQQKDKAKVTGSSKGIFKLAQERKTHLDQGPRRDSAPPSLEVFKTSLDKALRNLE